MSKIYNRRNEGKRQNSNFNVSISIRMTMSCRMSVLQPGQNRKQWVFIFRPISGGVTFKRSSLILEGALPAKTPLVLQQNAA